MLGLSSADHRSSPPILDIPREYNAAHDLIERNLRAGRHHKTAYIDDAGTYSYEELAQRVDRCANALLGLGLQPEQRILLCLQDTIDFPTVFLGAIKAGIVPVAVNTLLKAADYDYMLRDSRARALFVSAALLPGFAPLLQQDPHLQHVIVSRGRADGCASLDDLLGKAASRFEPAATSCDDPCFWLYSSGSTGAPKGTIHVHSSLIQTAELYARPILGLRESDVVFSAAKLFFAYGLGNGLTFPLAVGATAVLMAERPTPQAVFARLQQHRPTVFGGVPTLYATMLSAKLPGPEAIALRACISAGEALPREIGERWKHHFGVDILDGIGSTEMLHIFLSNRPGDVFYGTTGSPVPGYQLRLVDDEGRPVPPGHIGELQISGPTRAHSYWNNREKTSQTFQGAWVRSGDKYYVDEKGHYVYAGRSDDMLKVSGIYVSPAEVESALIAHPAVLEAAVIGAEDAEGLIKPLACVVLNPGTRPSPALTEQLKQHVKSLLAPHKYPRRIEFLDELPKTATGKIQRFKLRELYGRPLDGNRPAIAS
ncbi:MAG TPA: benzoate-CoA ligase family protein [Steroidobacteraceae bacterium]|nr:benzoate-CoA ligase family protein [Steroidobacteraceae bacterium]